MQERKPLMTKLLAVKKLKEKYQVAKCDEEKEEINYIIMLIETTKSVQDALDWCGYTLD